MGKARRKPAKMMPGYEGRVERIVPVRISHTRKEPRVARNRPGDFHWRYNRDGGNAALYHAGIKFAELWERAGIASAGSPSLEGGSTVGWKGLPDSRTVILDELRFVFETIGKISSARLSRYCVDGHTASEIAAQCGVPERDMAKWLESDLRDCAVHFRML